MRRKPMFRLELVRPPPLELRTRSIAGMRADGVKRIFMTLATAAPQSPFAAYHKTRVVEAVSHNSCVKRRYNLTSFS